MWQDTEEPSPFDEYPDAAADVSNLHLTVR